MTIGFRIALVAVCGWSATANAGSPIRAIDANAANLRAMIADPADLEAVGTPATGRGSVAASAVQALIDGKAKALTDPRNPSGNSGSRSLTSSSGDQGG